MKMRIGKAGRMWTVDASPFEVLVHREIERPGARNKVGCKVGRGAPKVLRKLVFLLAH